jgi:uncharacterized membrane protein YesL
MLRYSCLCSNYSWMRQGNNNVIQVLDFVFCYYYLIIIIVIYLLFPSPGKSLFNYNFSLCLKLISFNGHHHPASALFSNVQMKGIEVIRSVFL